MITKLLILVIDDNPHEGRLVQDVLQHLRIAARVVIAGTGREGLELLRPSDPDSNALRPDFIILDQQMPGMSGTEVLGELDRDPELSAIPVLHWSSQAEIDVCTAFHHGRCGRKPSDLTEYRRVCDLIRAILPTSHQQNAKAA
jgi:CheY-like chemotaxis protein